MDVNLELADVSEAEMYALANFVKRIGYVEYKQNAESDGEANQMRSEPTAPKTIATTAKRRLSRNQNRAVTKTHNNPGNSRGISRKDL